LLLFKNCRPPDFNRGEVPSQPMADKTPAIFLSIAWIKVGLPKIFGGKSDPKISSCMKFYTYILYSESTNRFYIGSCADLELRLQCHNAGLSRSTKHGRPRKIAYFEIYQLKSDI
jgi:GIY-YIG catalytic domain-containing protein